MYEFSFDCSDEFLPVTPAFSVALRLSTDSTPIFPRWNRNSSLPLCATLTTNVLCDIFGARVKGELSLACHVNDAGEIALSVAAALPNHTLKAVVLHISGMSPSKFEFVSIERERSIREHKFVQGFMQPIHYPSFAKMPIWFVSTAKNNELSDHQRYIYWHGTDAGYKSVGTYFHSARGEQLVVAAHHVRMTAAQNATLSTTIEFGTVRTREEIITKRLRELEQNKILVPYVLRKDKPDWLDTITLNIHFHGQHWTGRVINSFNQMGRFIESVREDLKPGAFVCSLLGWDGAYYRSPGELMPERRLGGKTEFLNLLSIIHGAGGRAIVFQPFNIIGRALVTQNGWEDGVLRRRWGAEAWCDWVDWDGDLIPEPSGVFMNLGYEPFRDWLLNKYREVFLEYPLDGAYFDITNYWEDDPHHDHLEGVHSFLRELRGIKKDLLVCAENWYDLIIGLFPMFGEPGNYVGEADLLLRYARASPYIACPSPHGSSGVHEVGRNSQEHHTLKSFNLGYMTIDSEWSESIDKFRELVRQYMARDPRIYSLSKLTL